MCSARADVRFWPKRTHLAAATFWPLDWNEPILILIKGSEFRHDRHSRNRSGGVNAQSSACDKTLLSNYSRSGAAGWFCLAVLRRDRHGTPENHQGRVYRWCRWWLRHFDLPGQAISADHWWRQRRYYWCGRGRFSWHGLQSSDCG